ncbi:hypothetical protein EV702DRAFT_1091347, partial [Suillus placidus]
ISLAYWAHAWGYYIPCFYLFGRRYCLMLNFQWWATPTRTVFPLCKRPRKILFDFAGICAMLKLSIYLPHPQYIILWCVTELLGVGVALANSTFPLTIRTAQWKSLLQACNETKQRVVSTSVIFYAVKYSRCSSNSWSSMPERGEICSP